MTSHDTTVMQMPKHSNVRLYTLALVSSMGAIMFGYDLAFVGTTLALKSFQKYVPHRSRRQLLITIDLSD